MKLTKSLEDYIEAIFLLDKSGEPVRISSISLSLKVKKPSVISAVKALKGKNLVEQEKYGHIRLTPAGKKTARRIALSHGAVKDLLCLIGVREKDASKQACEIEHAINPSTYQKIVALVKKLKRKKA